MSKEARILVGEDAFGELASGSIVLRAQCMTGTLGQSSLWIPALGRRIDFVAKDLDEYVHETLVQFSSDLEVNDVYASDGFSRSQLPLGAMEFITIT
jgi:hypothetical protein